MRSMMGTEEQRIARDRFILDGLKRLRVPGIVVYYQDILDGTVDVANMDIDEVLEEMVATELLRRKDNKTQKLIKEARLWFPSAGLEDLKGANAKIPKQTISTLSRCSFVEARAFVLISGRPRSGTTYLGCALGVSCCKLNHSTRYVRYFDMLEQLVSGKNTDKLTEALATYRTVPCLIIDDWMNAPIRQNEFTMMREVIDYRSHNGGTILISHTHQDNWKDFIESQTSYKESFFRTMTEGSTFIELN